MKGIKADEKLDQAFDILSGTNIQTLLFVYSGHHDVKRGFQLGPNVNYNLNKVSLRLNKWNEENPNFGKVIAFLDCCFPKKMNLNSSLKLIQFNATSPTTPADLETKEGSPFLNYVIQAITARANGKVCKIKECECHERILGNFITLHDLWNYLNEHIQLQRETSLYMIAANIELRDTLLAYNYDFEVKFEFTIKWLETAERKKYVRPMEFNEFERLKLILAKDILSEFVFSALHTFVLFCTERIYMFVLNTVKFQTYQLHLFTERTLSITTRSFIYFRALFVSTISLLLTFFTIPIFNSVRYY
ncbi:hypothetical protein DPMN_064870 [Dreissena polymorpha]|uniref:Uncharacterized protein n=1 Tax=Dreissena polymorpha TaxID=45954 RepID=A0A9D4CE44_DREPO|nr:hypothetical protein DPMN_064870 [Dreissena polymorpha]